MTSEQRHELLRRGTCPTCGSEYERLAAHWRGTCSPPALDTTTRELVAGLLLGNGRVGGNGANKHFQLTTRWRPFALWVYDELGWLAACVVRLDGYDEQDDRPTPAQQYLVRTHAHPALTRFRAWYSPFDDNDDGESDTLGANNTGTVNTENEIKNSETTNGGRRGVPLPEDLPNGRLTPRAGRAWHATAGSLGWSNPEYATTRQAYFSAAADTRATRFIRLFESVGFDPTRTGRGVQLSPKQTASWLAWIGTTPVPGVEYKWVDGIDEYRDLKHDAENLRTWLWFHPEAESRLSARR